MATRGSANTNANANGGGRGFDDGGWRFEDVPTSFVFEPTVNFEPEFDFLPASFQPFLSLFLEPIALGISGAVRAQGVGGEGDCPCLALPRADAHAHAHADANNTNPSTPPRAAGHRRGRVCAEPRP